MLNDDLREDASHPAAPTASCTRPIYPPDHLTVFKLSPDIQFAVHNSKVEDIYLHKIRPSRNQFNESSKFYWFLKTPSRIVSLASTPVEETDEEVEVARFTVEQKQQQQQQHHQQQQQQRQEKQQERLQQEKQQLHHTLKQYARVRSSLCAGAKKKVKLKRKRRLSKDVVYVKEMPNVSNKWAPLHHTKDEPPKRQDKLSSITSGTSKLVRRLGGYTAKKPISKSVGSNDIISPKDVAKTPLKNSPSLELGSEVQLEYNGVTVTGLIRYIGTTDFSPGKWCGIELTSNIGKHNGTVNGKCYFVCRDSYGVFIRFNKVAEKLSPRPTHAPAGHTPGHHLKDPSDMRITVKSVKSKSTSLPVSQEAYICETTDTGKPVALTNGRIKSSVKSYIKAKKDKKLSTKEIIDEIRKEKNGVAKGVAKNVVVSSFTAPAPVAPVVVSPSSNDPSDGITTSPLSGDEVIDDVFLFNNLSPAEETADETSSSSSLDDTVTADYVNDVPGNMSEKIPATPDAETDTHVDLTASRIPRRIGSIRKLSNSSKEVGVTTTNDRQKNVSTSCAEFNGNLRKFSKDRHASESCIPTRTVVTNECEPKTPAPFPKVFRSSKRALEFNGKLSTAEQRLSSENGENCENRKPRNESEDKTTTKSFSSKCGTVAMPENSIARPRSTPSVSRKPMVTSSVAIPRKTPTPVMPRKNESSLHKSTQALRSSIREQVKELNGVQAPGVPGQTENSRSKSFTLNHTDDSGKNADAATVMGNASVINASCYKKNSMGECDPAADVAINLPEMVDSTVIQNEIHQKKSSKDGKTKKTLAKTNSSKSFKDSAKDLQKEVDNLQNQLKERTDRINELELTIKNNNNNNLEERNELERKSCELESQLKAKNLNILEVEGKYTNSQLLVTKSAKGFEALGIVIQYYLQQIERVTKQLSEALEEKEKLSIENGDLSNQNDSTKTELQDIMKKLDAEKSRCEGVQHDLETLAVSHEAEINALAERHQQEQDSLKSTLLREKDQGIGQVKDEHLTEIERLKADHQKEIATLTHEHQTQIQDLLQEKGNAINDLLTKHDLDLKANETEHSKAVEELKKLHEIKCDELNERVNLTANERDRVQSRIEEIQKELENDSKVQQALIPYKHLPEELQSLQVVLDLRNEEIKNNRLKNMELQKKVDEYYELKTKFDSLSQENASLKESLKKRTLSERKLSVERDALLEKFENEIKKVNLLSMEKEQLMWRASNPDLSTSLPNVFEDVEDEGCSMSPLRSSGSFSTSPPINFAPAKLKRRMQPKLLRRVNTMSFYKTFNKVERK